MSESSTLRYKEYVQLVDAQFRDALSIQGDKELEKDLSVRRAARRQYGVSGVVLTMAPHPDDECITGALAVRLNRELGMEVTNIPVTLGSQPDRRMARLRELRDACAYLGFGLLLDSVVEEGHGSARLSWLRATLRSQRPSVIVCPHNGDGHATHIRTNKLLFEALKACEPTFMCRVVETEYWQPMSKPAPNLVVESRADDVADLVVALSLHRGEVTRNPYHLRLPAWMMDNVRRSELIAGAGNSVPGFTFCTIYRLRQWRAGRIEECLNSPRFIGADQNIRELVG